METRKKCAQCNTLNDGNRIYCINCGKYLKGRVVKQEENVTIWGIDDSLGDIFHDSDSTFENNSQNNFSNGIKRVVICPDCGLNAPVIKDSYPTSCISCGYFFQYGIDKITEYNDAHANDSTKGIGAAADVKPGEQTGQASDRNASSRGSGPLGRASKDDTSLRLVSITGNQLPVMMRESGNIVGKNGTAFTDIISEGQISIWHTATGWYARALSGSVLFNGVLMNQGVQVKLSSGDLFVMDKAQFSVDIF